MGQYEDLKDEMGSIAKILSDYPEALQTKVFDILIKSYFSDIGIPVKSSEVIEDSKIENNDILQEEKPKIKKQVKAPSKKSTSKGETYVLVKDLDLSGKNGAIPFKEYFEKHPAKTANKFNAVAVGYLQHVMGLEEITVNHVYTCYKNVSMALPQRLMQSIWDTGSKNGYLDYKDNCIFLTTIGENFLDELEKKEVSK